MTNEEINIAIAEACGRVSQDQHGKLYRSDKEGWTRNCPDYCNDLNAMHEAEKMLNDILHVWDRYCDFLGGSLYHCAHATARKRAEAFLRTLRKWTK